MPKDMTDKETAEMKAVTKKMLTALLPAISCMIEAAELHNGGDVAATERAIDNATDFAMSAIITANNERWFD